MSKEDKKKAPEEAKPESPQKPINLYGRPSIPQSKSTVRYRKGRGFERDEYNEYFPRFTLGVNAATLLFLLFILILIYHYLREIHR